MTTDQEDVLGRFSVTSDIFLYWDVKKYRFERNEACTRNLWVARVVSSNKWL